MSRRCWATVLLIQRVCRVGARAPKRRLKPMRSGGSWRRRRRMGGEVRVRHWRWVARAKARAVRRARGRLPPRKMLARAMRAKRGGTANQRMR